MQYLYSVYFVNQLLRVSGIFVAHHQEIYCIYTKIGMCCAFQSTKKHNTFQFSNYQLNAQFFYFATIYMLHYAPQHVSSSTLLILRRTNCITTAFGIVTLCKQPYSKRVESGL